VSNCDDEDAPAPSSGRRAAVVSPRSLSTRTVSWRGSLARHHGPVQFNAEQLYTHGIGDVLDAYADPSLYPALPELPSIGRPEVLDHRHDGDRVELDIRYAYIGELPPAALAIIDPAKLTWIQRTAIDLRGATSSIVLEPDHYPDRLRCSGTYRFAADPAGGCRRRVGGDLEVKVVLVAGQVERALVNGLQEFLAAEAVAVDGWLDRSI
jgi:hypothetical protein